MKKSIVLILMLVLALGLAPIFSQASDVPDGQDCANAAAGPSVTFNPDPNDPANADRGAVCVSDGSSANGAELYVGGELQAEEEGDPDAGGSCGALIVGGTTLAGDPNWDNPDPDGDPETDDATHCD